MNYLNLTYLNLTYLNLTMQNMANNNNKLLCKFSGLELTTASILYLYTFIKMSNVFTLC